MSSTSAPHEFIPAKSTDSRSPCPALNALANHGYLPRDGKNISISQLTSVLGTIYGTSLPLSFLLATGGYLLCGHGLGKLDLDSLRKHNVIEHDGSMAHRDLDESGGTVPTNHPDPKLLQAIIDSSDGVTVTLENLINVKQVRESRANIHSAADYHSKILPKFSRGEPILAVSIIGESDKGISVERVRTWFGEERLPDGFVHRQTIGLVALQSKVEALTQELDALHAALANDRRNE